MRNYKKIAIEYLRDAIKNGTTEPVIIQNLAEIFSESYNESVAPANSKIPKKFKVVKKNHWEQPVMNNYLMKCCDCGLVHEVDFRIVYGKEDKYNRVQLRMRRI